MCSKSKQFRLGPRMFYSSTGSIRCLPVTSQIVRICGVCDNSEPLQRCLCKFLVSHPRHQIQALHKHGQKRNVSNPSLEVVTIDAIPKKSNSGTFYPASANYRDSERDRGSGRDRDPAVHTYLPTISSSNEQNRCWCAIKGAVVQLLCPRVSECVRRTCVCVCVCVRTR